MKAALRAKGWTYRQLAGRLGLSESGLKKAMTSGDLSLGRLFQICEICDIPVATVFAAADDRAISPVTLSREQEDFLLRHPKALKLYWRMKVDGLSRTDFQKRYGLSRAETDPWVRQLERVGLLRMSARGQIEFTHRGAIRWAPESPLVKHLNGVWSRRLLDRAIEGAGPADFINLSGLRLSETQVAELRADALDLFEKYSRLSGRSAPDRRTTSLALLVAFTPFDFEP